MYDSEPPKGYTYSSSGRSIFRAIMAQALFWKGFSVDDRRRLFVTSPASVPIIDANSNALFVNDARRPLSLDRRELAEPRRWRPDGRRGGGGASAPVFDSPTSSVSLTALKTYSSLRST